MYPAQLQYNNINPKGFFSSFKQWQIQPVANGGYYWPGQNVKILIQSIVNGVMDPYRSHLQFTVFCNEAQFPVGLLQMDSSAQSLIQQLVISSRNKQVQRIPQYGILAAWLTDIGLAQMYAQGRQTQGLGYNNVQSNNQFAKQSISQNIGFMSGTGGGTNGVPDDNNLICGRSSGNIFPTQTSGLIPRYYNVPLGNQQQYAEAYYYNSRLTKGILTATNICWQNNLKQHTTFKDLSTAWDAKDIRKTCQQALINQTGYFNNLRAQYLQHMQNNKYPDSTTSCPTTQIHLNSQLFRATNATSYGLKDPVFQAGDVYKPYVPQTLNARIPQFQHGATTTTNTQVVYQDLPNHASFWGYSTLYSPNFCKGTNEPFISPTVPQCQMQNGHILPVKKPVKRRTFKVPIISAILGLLIPQDQFVLLPIKALNDVLIQIVLDKFGMFTSGYNDISQLDDLGAGSMQARAFGIQRVSYNMHTYSFWDPMVDDYLNKALTEGILLNCNMWTLGNQYTIAKGDQVTNNWPVACTSQALNEIVVLFVSSDYMKYSFCRKHFRLSNNLTKFQLRVNMQYFPPMPLIGNGGNPNIIQNNDDNSTFLQQIFWSNNFMFNKVNPFPRINAYNFAINQRCYNVRKQGPMYPTTLRKFDSLGVKNTKYKGFDEVKTNKNYDTFNLQTAMGLANIHQNRYVGKAGYVLSFQPYAHSQNFLVGLDCRNIRQFDVIVTAGSVNPFPRQQQMFIYTRSSVIVKYTNNGIQTFGR